jgi:6-phosphogluconolactonase (cycloisomerase 2 family)
MKRLRRVLLGIGLLVFGFFFCSDDLFSQNFIYTNNNTTINSVSVFALAADGTLTEIEESPFLTGGSGYSNTFIAANMVTLCVANNYIFVSNEGSNTVSVFSMDKETGVLSPIPGSPFATGGSGCQGLAITPDNRFLFAANTFSNNISVLSIGVDGSLTPCTGSPVSCVNTPDGIKVTPDGNYLVISTPSSKELRVYSISPAGILVGVSGSPFLVGASLLLPAGIEINSEGNLVFVGLASTGPSAVAVFNIGAQGSLTPVSGSPFSDPEGVNSNCVLLSADEKFLFCSNTFSGTVGAFSVASDGTLSRLAGSPYPAGVSTPCGMATNQLGNLLFVAHYYGAIAVLNIGLDGSLAPVSQSPFVTGRGYGLVSLVVYPPKSFELPVSVDINPNALNPLSKGVLSVVIAGTEEFDVKKIDPSTVKISLEGNSTMVPALRWNYEDVALGADGYLDLSLKFSRVALNDAFGLDSYGHKSQLTFIITGTLKPEDGGRTISGKDTIRIVNNRQALGNDTDEGKVKATGIKDTKITERVPRQVNHRIE